MISSEVYVSRRLLGNPGAKYSIKLKAKKPNNVKCVKNKQPNLLIFVLTEHQN